ncbi:MAG: BMC domain-containing protein [Candidatus Caldatribacteriota bacterium]|nr:BMC domain-containing protein [Candidatus Caldatribacteriota bacterium]
MKITVLGVLEFNSIAIGIKALDEIVKAAPVKIIDAKTLCPGKFIVIFSGDVASVDTSLTAGKNIGEGYIVDELFIPNLHPQVIPAIIGAVDCKVWGAVAVIETFSIVTSIEAADIAAKEANILVNEIRLAVGMGGKSYTKMIGDIYQIEAAVKAAVNLVGNKGLLCKDIIIPNPNPAIKPYFIY